MGQSELRLTLWNQLGPALFATRPVRFQSIPDVIGSHIV